MIHHARNGCPCSPNMKFDRPEDGVSSASRAVTRGEQAGARPPDGFAVGLVR